MNNFLYVINSIAVIYGTLFFIAGAMQLKGKSIPTWSACSTCLAGLCLAVSACLLFFVQASVYLIIISLLLIHGLAMINGLYLHGKMTLHHHVFRLCLSAVIIVSNMFL